VVYPSLIDSFMSPYKRMGLFLLKKPADAMGHLRVIYAFQNLWKNFDKFFRQTQGSIFALLLSHSQLFLTSPLLYKSYFEIPNDVRHATRQSPSLWENMRSYHIIVPKNSPVPYNKARRTAGYCKFQKTKKMSAVKTSALFLDKNKTPASCS